RSVRGSRRSRGRRLRCVARSLDAARGGEKRNFDRSVVPVVQSNLPSFTGVPNEKTVGRKSCRLVCVRSNLLKCTDAAASIRAAFRLRAGLGVPCKNACCEWLRTETRRGDS